MHKNKNESYRCRICGLEQDFQPWGEDGQTPTFELCGCCGVDFGYQDCTLVYVKKFREKWLKKRGKWANPDEKPPNWSLEEQLKQIPQEYK
ncbi:MAG: hypothetical protein AABZ92_03200 [Verrucomicrobiota bacterium]